MSSGTGTLSADGSAPAVEVAGDVILHASGGFGGGTILFEKLLPDAVTWIPLETLTASGTFFRRISGEVRVTLAGATTPNITWAIQ